MPLPLQFIPSVRRYRKKSLTESSSPTPPPSNVPVLIAVSYTPGVAASLQFDRAVNAEAAIASAFVVTDEPNGTVYEGSGVGNVSPTTVEVELSVLAETEGGLVRLTAAANNGIVADADGTPWPGVTGVVIPFGE